MNNTVDMTEGSATRHIIVFAIPMLIGNIFQQVYNLVDSIIVGRFVGADALAAVGATSSICFFFFALCNGISMGGGIVTSQYFGAHDEKYVKKSIANTAYIMLIFPMVLGIVAYYYARPLLCILNTPETVLADSLGYLRIMCLGLLFVSVYNYVSAMLRALGDSRTPLYFLIFSCLLNVVLDVVFVYILNTGVAGAGYATVISQFVGGAICLIYAFSKNPYFKMSKEDFSVDITVIKNSIKLGIPLSLQFSLIAISTMALQRVVNSFGAVAIAAFTATSRIEQLIHQPYASLGGSLATFSGQNFGAKKKDRVIDGYRKGMIIMCIFSLIMLPIMQFGGRAIISLFVSEEAVIAMGAKALKITSIFYALLGMIYVVRGVLNGVGDAFFALLNGIVEVVGRFTIPIFLTMYTPLSLWGIWWSVGIVWGISGITAWFRYLYKRKTLLM